MSPVDDRIYWHSDNWQQWARAKCKTKIFNISNNAQQSPLTFLKDKSVRGRLAAALLRFLS